MTHTLTSATVDWKTRLSDLLPLLGHRNWVVVADSAYPLQSKDGIETIISGEDHLDVVRHVQGTIHAATHVRANVYVDQELSHVAEMDAPGMEEYRKGLESVFHLAKAKYAPHDQIIAKLDQSAQAFRVLIIKTDMTIPYTSVFFELDCGYWDADAEQRLRQAIAASDAN
jgi:hypothetical protein